MIRSFKAFINGHTADLDAVQKEIERRRQAALNAIAERRKRDPDFHVREETITDATADEQTRTLMRKLAGVTE